MRIPRLRSSTPDGFTLRANDDDDDDDDDNDDDDDEDDGGLRNLSPRTTCVASGGGDQSSVLPAYIIIANHDYPRHCTRALCACAFMKELLLARGAIMTKTNEAHLHTNGC